jgi:hypothetical protein
MDRCEREEIDLGDVLAQKIWLRRNFVVYGGSFCPACPNIQGSQGDRGEFSPV